MKANVHRPDSKFFRIAAFTFLVVSTTTTALGDEPEASGESVISSTMACGPNAVQEILNFYGRKSNFTDLLDEVAPKEDGSTMLDLSSCLNNHGIKSLGVDLGRNVRLCWGFWRMSLKLFDGETRELSVKFVHESMPSHDNVRRERI